MIKKRSIRKWIDQTAFHIGLLDWLIYRMYRGITILNYHRIIPFEQLESYPLPSLVVAESVFKKQVYWLSQNCKVLTVDEAIIQLRKIKKSDKPIVCITFDDGYSDNYDIAAPILESYNLRATFYVTTKFISSKVPLWHDYASEIWKNYDCEYLFEITSKLQNSSITYNKFTSISDWMQFLKRNTLEQRIKILKIFINEKIEGKMVDYRSMTIDQLIRLSQCKHEIGAHSINHPILTQLDGKELVHEIIGSRKELQSWISASVSGFCFPNGSYNDQTISVVKKAGYKYACTTSEGINIAEYDPFRLQRVDITTHRVTDEFGRYDKCAFLAELTGFHNWFR